MPACPCSRSLPEGPQRRCKSSSTAFCWYRPRCCHGHSGMPEHCTAWLLSPAERSSLRWPCSCAGDSRAIGKRRSACSCFRFRTYSCCLPPCCPAASAIDRRGRSHRVRTPGGSRDPLRSQPSSSRSLPQSLSPLRSPTRSKMRYRLLALVLLSVTLGGCSEDVLDPKGPIAAAERLILFNSLGIMLAIVIPTILATLAVAFWFRASTSRAAYLPDFEYSGRLELLVWSIPAMTVLLVGGVAWVGAHDLGPRKPISSSASPVTVQVVSLDWKWLFIYPEQGIASVNKLVVPVGTPISFELTSSSVMNSFFVPQLGSQIYTMSGMATRLHLQADHLGTYAGISAMFSGDGFPDMHFTVDAVTDDGFAQWVRQTRGAGSVLGEQSCADLAKPSKAVAPFTYRAVSGDLFSGIVNTASAMDNPSQLICSTSQKAEQ